MICRQIIVKGKVQGVYFRASAQEIAEILGLAGEVKNLLNGDVCAIVEGPEEKVAKFTSWCREGPPNARVSEVEIEDISLRGYKGFHVTR
jgi:acylphosphatase